MDLRKIEISSDIFGGFYTFIDIDKFHSKEDICTHIKDLLLSQLMGANLEKLSNILLSIEFDIHMDYTEILATTDTIWVCDCGSKIKITYCQCNEDSEDDKTIAMEGVLESMKKFDMKY